MGEKEILKISIEEFSRLQDYMLASNKDSNAYKLMLTRYHNLKIILTSSSIKLTDIDRLKK